MPNIRDSLRDFNPWWRDAFTIEFKEREIYQKIQKYIPLPQIIAFTGIRRIGKTTLLFKIVEDAIKNGFNPQNIVYFSFDEYPSVDIKKIINEYEELMSKNIRKDKYLFLLDEVQKLANWEAQVKVIYDLFKNIKIFLSGSESLFVRKGARESLAGRLFEFQVEPLSFKEFLLFQEVNLAPIELYEKDLLGLFNDFILTMGFPELVGIKEKEIIKKYVEKEKPLRLAAYVKGGTLHKAIEQFWLRLGSEEEVKRKMGYTESEGAGMPEPTPEEKEEVDRIINANKPIPF